MIMPFHVTAWHCSANNRVLPHTLAHLCQQAASDHADQLGFGFENLNRRGLLWALVVLRLEILRQPRLGMELELSTWPSHVQRLRASREFRLTDRQGEVFMLGSSDWMVLDVQSRKAVDVAGLGFAPPVRGERMLGDKLARHKAEASGQELESWPVSLSALDINGHVNNTEYVRSSHDALYRAGMRGEVGSLWMSFHSEAFLNDELRLLYIQMDAQHCIAGFREQTPVFSAVFTEK